MVSFIKMHGNGNDFVLLDGRQPGFIFPTPAERRQLTHRQFGIGCDQLLVLLPAQKTDAEAFLRVYNADGEESAACGNGTRCAMRWLANQVMCEGEIRVETEAGVLLGKVTGDQSVTLQQGPLTQEWEKIPLKSPCDPFHVVVNVGKLREGAVVNVGNPHIVFCVADVNTIPLDEWGPLIERHPFFPEKINVHIVQVLTRNTVKQRTWERGAGLTLSCGTGAAAVAFLLVQQGLTEDRITVQQPGGELSAYWPSGAPYVEVTGPTAIVYTGEWRREGETYVA